MRPVIYVDVLLCVNFFVDCMLLYISGRLAGGRLTRTRLCLAAAVGAVDSLFLLLPDAGRLLSMANTFAAAAAMSCTAFGIKDRARLMRGFLWLMLTTLCYGGIMTALWLFASPSSLVVSNGIAYIDISPTMLIGGTVICYGALTLWARIARKKNEIESICEIRISKNGREVCAAGIVDTGNLLTEPFSGYPVVICELAFVEPIMEADFVSAVREGRAPTGARVIPYSSVGGDGVIFAFRPDSVEIETQETSASSDRVYVGVLGRGRVSASARAIVNPDIIY